MLNLLIYLLKELLLLKTKCCNVGDGGLSLMCSVISPWSLTFEDEMSSVVKSA